MPAIAEHILEEPGAGPRQTTAAEPCFHCGQPCAGSDHAREDRSFCCQGCLVVHDLLCANGLGHFYDLSEAPGVRLDQPSNTNQWTYLDQPDVAEHLLDFADAKISRVTFHIPAIHCIACVWLLENLFQLHTAIGRSQVNFPKREVAISFTTGAIALSELAALLTSLGYRPELTLENLDKRAPAAAGRRRWLQLGLAGFAFGNIMLFSLPVYLGLDSFSGPFFKALFGYLSLALALPSLVYSASDYWRSAALSFRQRRLTLDVPIALGLAAIYGQSLYEIISGAGAGYCDSLAGLIFFLLCGRVFQQKTHERLAFDRDYKSFFPLSVVRVTEAEEQTVAISHLVVGDRLRLRHGELVPADARLIAGSGLLDYSFVTGESEPIAKGVGEHLYAGGRQLGGAIEVETVKPVSQSYLTSLWSHEAFRKERVDNLNTLTNRYSRRFTRLVIVVAFGAAFFWLFSAEPARAVKAFTSVLIVACPCALALAAPFALGTAQRILARNQVFLKNPLLLERLARADTLIFDKTGTLSTAQSGTVSFLGLPLGAKEEAMACSLARHSTHPHSIRLAAEASLKVFPLSTASFEETPGSGISGRVGGHEVQLGSTRWLKAQKVKVPEAVDAEMGSVVGLSIDGEFRGAYLLNNAVRPEIGPLLRELGQDYELVLLSGDNERDRECFTQLFGRGARLHFNQSPLDKLSFVRELQAGGKTVVMVGDGLNDAGALRQSDVGIAVVEKIGAFSPASDVILEAAQVRRLPEVLGLARKTAAIVRLSFLISALYNAVGIGIAAAGLLSPLVCAILMPLSSVSVICFACGTTRWAGRCGGLASRTQPDWSVL
jgi:Cu+-exporting ATPase